MEKNINSPEELITDVLKEKHTEEVHAVSPSETVIKVQEEKIVLPFIHESQQTSCDFCGNPRSQKYKFDISSGTSRELRVCSSSKCDTEFSKSRLEFLRKENRIPFEDIQDSLPGLLDPKRQWKVMRGNGTLEDNWKIARNWRVACEMSSLSTLRGEPWWRIPLQNNDKVRLTLIQELNEFNKDAFAEDVWDMLLKDILPSFSEEPSETFLEFYPAKVWKLSNPSEAKLLELRI
jgi:hypothetical protein